MLRLLEEPHVEGVLLDIVANVFEIWTRYIGFKGVGLVTTTAEYLRRQHIFHSTGIDNRLTRVRACRSGHIQR
jgi:hypothetical protein